MPKCIFPQVLYLILFNGQSVHIVVDNGIEILDPLYDFTNHIIPGKKTSQKMRDYLDSNVESEFDYKSTPSDAGHTEHRGMLVKSKYQPASPGDITAAQMQDGFILNDVVYKRKNTHTQINPDWDDTDILYEFAYALSRKKIEQVKLKSSNHGSQGYHARTEYSSQLMDGTRLEIMHENYFRYNLSSIITDHYSSLKMIILK